MGKTTSRKIIFSRRRLNVRKYLKVKNFLILTCCILAVLVVTSFVSMQLLKNKVSKSTIKYTAKNTNVEIKEIKSDEENIEVSANLDNNQDSKKESKED